MLLLLQLSPVQTNFVQHRAHSGNIPLSPHPAEEGRQIFVLEESLDSSEAPAISRLTGNGEDRRHWP